MNIRSLFGQLGALYFGLWHYASGSRIKMISAFGLLLVAEMLLLAVPWFVGHALNAIQHNGSPGIAEAGRDLGLVFLTTVASWALHLSGRILERNVALKIRTTFTMELLRRLLLAPLAWHRIQHSADTTQRVIQSTNALHQFSESQYIYLENIVRLIGPIAALCFISPWVGVAAIFGFSSISLISMGFDRILINLSTQRNQAERNASVAWTDTFANLFTIYALRRYQGVRVLIQRRLNELLVPLRRFAWINEAKWVSISISSTAVWCLLLAMYAMLALRGGAHALALGSLYMVYEYTRRTEGVMSVIANNFAMLAEYQAGFASSRFILQAPQSSQVSEIAPTNWRELQLRDLSYRYFNGEQNEFSLNSVDLTLKRGKRYALVGPSGAGKSSLLRLLSGLEIASTGQICLDERIAESTDLRREATLIPQEAELFIGTVAENLTLGASLPEAQIDLAMAIVCATEFISELPKGMTTRVNESGANWSGGQRQRIALARGVAAAMDSSLVLLDEPTSNLDPDTETRVMHGLLAGFTGNTMIVALHRMHLLPLFDEVIFMIAGRVVDVGSFETLNVRCALFHDFVRSGNVSLKPRPAEARHEMTSGVEG